MSELKLDITDRIAAAVRDIEDFPKPGILFKDITPIFLDYELTKDVALAFINRVDFAVDAVVGIESRGFLLGPMIAQGLQVPFIPIRKEGKLPGDTIAYSYDLEYGSSTIEIHKDVLKPGDRVLVHDDLIATGGTVIASAELIRQQQAHVAGFSFLVALTFLEGLQRIRNYSENIISLVDY